MQFSSVQSLSRVQLCDPTDYSMPGLPVYHQLPEFTQTHANWVDDAIQPYTKGLLSVIITSNKIIVIFIIIIKTNKN